MIRLDKQNNQNNQPEINRLAGGEFLQSKFWGEMAEKGGEIVERWGVKTPVGKGSENGKAGENIMAVVTIIRKPLLGPFFYWYAPRGPRGNVAAGDFLLLELRNKKSSAVFLRIEPEELSADEGVKSYLKKSLDLQPKKTLLLDLAKSEEELLKEMGQKTRYNIKLAEKKGVKIIAGTSFGGADDIKAENDFIEFWRLMSLTGERDAFRLHGAAHYRNLLRAGKVDGDIDINNKNADEKKNSEIKLFFASVDGKNIAAGLFCFFGDRVTYMHGASDNEARNFMAPHLLQWEMIKQAKKEGYKYYDFYGIDEKKWPGVTRFKVGFGGFVKEYPGTYDFVFRPIIYGLYEFLRKLRRSLK